MLIVIISLLELFFVGLDWFTDGIDNKCITGMYSDVSICAFCSLGSYSIRNIELFSKWHSGVCQNFGKFPQVRNTCNKQRSELAALLRGEHVDMLVFTCRLLGGQRRFFKIAPCASASYRPIGGVIGVGSAASTRLKRSCSQRGCYPDKKTPLLLLTDTF